MHRRTHIPWRFWHIRYANETYTQVINSSIGDLLVFGPSDCCKEHGLMLLWKKSEICCGALWWFWGCLQRVLGCPNRRKIIKNLYKNQSNNLQKISKNCIEINQNRSTELSWRDLGPSWPQDGPKSAKNFENWFLGLPLGGHFGAQNRSKSGPRAIWKVIVSMIDLKIDFGIDLVPTWHHLGFQNPPKIGPSWLQNRCKLECWFEGCFLMDVGTIFIFFYYNMTCPK